MDVQLLTGDVRDVLATLSAASVQTCVTSPPYYGLRAYLAVDHPDKVSEIGIEQTPEAFVAVVVDVFRAVWRVLRDDGTLWLNLGDSYGPNKQLIGIPWRVAFALQADGWYLRSDIIWSKPNVMPESVTDRPTKAHEYLFLLTKSARYFYDADAIKEPATGHEQGSKGVGEWNKLPSETSNGRGASTLHMIASTSTRNKRTVWTVPTKPYKGAHFATFPPALIEPCILAGTSERGACPACGAPWKRTVEHVAGDAEAQFRPKRTAGMDSVTSTLSLSGNGSAEWAKRGGATFTTGWQPTCTCDAGEPVPCVVFDPFSGSGTTGQVACQHGRAYIGIDLNAGNHDLARERLAKPLQRERQRTTWPKPAPVSANGYSQATLIPDV